MTCSSEEDRSYTLKLYLTLKNPFDKVYISFKPSELIGNKETRSFRILLSRSSLDVQLSQHIRYDECLDVKYVQIGPNPSYEIECRDCNESENANLNKLLKKMMLQIDAELDLALSDKFLLGLQYQLSEERLDLDL